MASEMKEMEERQDIQTLSPEQFKKILQEEIEQAFKTALQTAVKTAFENFWKKSEGSDKSEEKPSLPQLEEGEDSQDTEILFTEGTENQSEQEFIIKDPAESNLQGETITTVYQHITTNKLNRCSKRRKEGNLKTGGTSRKKLRKTTNHNRAKKRQKVIRKIYFTRKMETKKQKLKVDAHLYKELQHLNMVLAKRKLQKIKKRVLNCDLNIVFCFLVPVSNDEGLDKY
ncbi:UNVERIFIED_CONTAM: hypothetical protein K2H54_050750 [Gekko kuhli]